MRNSLFFKVPVFTLGFSPHPDSLLANFLGYISNITITTKQMIDLNTKTGLVGSKKKKERNWFLKIYIYIFQYFFKATSFCLQCESYKFLYRIYPQKQKEAWQQNFPSSHPSVHDTNLIYYLLFLHYKILTLKHSWKIQYIKTSSPYISTKHAI